ncbi:hypothetical protein [Bacteroides sp.]|uniref:hypothetical protein n=1 Tax=Bacteroides sp. TaxID=29523 RepID=UPI0026391CE1|nr:hypothetical protein [Bacteroides sp.]MDD3036477.1 hypothetical protein [Bacteroides sp.]
MKRFIYLLFFFITPAQEATAQDKEPLEISLIGRYPVPLGLSWYQAQKDAWEVELKKDKRNEKAWDNYVYACFAMWQTGEYIIPFLQADGDTLQKTNYQKEFRSVVKKMKKYIPDTRIYYRYLLVQTTDFQEQERIYRQIISLKRTCERDYLDDMRHFYDTHQFEKLKEIACEWYESGLYSSDLLSYCYNELAGLGKNAVLVVQPTANLFYYYLLQYSLGLFKDIEIISSVDLSNPVQGRWFWEKVGVDPKIFSESKKEAPGAEYFLEREKRPVYFSQFMYDKYLLEALKDKLYPEGLVLKYSLKPYNNMAVARKNYEQVYLLDYLRRPWSDYHPGITYSMTPNWNYIISFAPLLQFYRTSGDKNQYMKLKSLLQGILDRTHSFKPITADEKLSEAIMARQLEMKEKGEAVVKIVDRKDEFQKLIDGIEP